jgi:hypothetical protein
MSQRNSVVHREAELDELELHFPQLISVEQECIVYVRRQELRSCFSLGFLRIPRYRDFQKIVGFIGRIDGKRHDDGAESTRGFLDIETTDSGMSNRDHR